MLTPTVKLWLKKGNNSILGEGRAQLLRAIEEKGSITNAANAMNMSYRHAWGIIREIEDSLGEKIIKTERGGPEGGGAKLTALGRKILSQYESNYHEIIKLLKYGPRPVLTVDGVIFTKQDKIVLIRRKNQPFKGKLALPGGFVENNETTEEAVRREMSEELGIDTRIKRMIGVYSDPNRDPRQHTVSIVYELEPITEAFKAGDDAKDFEILSVENISKLTDLAFDHSKIIADIISKRKIK